MNDTVKRLGWQEVRDEINGWILSGRLAPGDRFDRDEDIAAQLGCSRATVQRAMTDLAERGIVERRRKGGTRVRPDPVTRATLEIPIARNEVEARGGAYGYHLIRAEMEEISRQMAAALDLRAPHRMLHIEALHLMDGRAFLYEDRWVCTRTVPEIMDVDLNVESANEWLVHNKPYSACDLNFSAEAANAHVAGIMGVEEGAALFVLNRTTWSGDDPITTVKAVHHPGYRMATRI